jgi:predicted Zn-dependent protease
VAQHELGHAVGLAHILDPFQLMSPMPVVVDWGRGDRKGLQELGEGPCLHVPTAELHAAIVPLP